MTPASRERKLRRVVRLCIAQLKEVEKPSDECGKVLYIAENVLRVCEEDVGIRRRGYDY